MRLAVLQALVHPYWSLWVRCTALCRVACSNFPAFPPQPACHLLSDVGSVANASNASISTQLQAKVTPLSHCLPAGVDAAHVTKAQQIILATADHHHLEGDLDGDVVIDADLSILSAPLQRYVEYTVSVRHEYGHLSDEEFTQGR